ncbi:hypothetical protein VNO77_39056 [Canavalia gladiata]|uniref:Uncharacterized protein n=1 Tax=Canavalia gladiata TaxID=3824 RepID=A0AAN9KDQ7_CANGL
MGICKHTIATTKPTTTSWLCISSDLKVLITYLSVFKNRCTAVSIRAISPGLFSSRSMKNQLVSRERSFFILSKNDHQLRKFLNRESSSSEEVGVQPSDESSQSYQD